MCARSPDESLVSLLGSAKGGTTTTRSPDTRRTDRLVARTVRDGQRREDGGELRSRVEYLLEVIQDQEEPPLVERQSELPP